MAEKKTVFLEVDSAQYDTEKLMEQAVRAFKKDHKEVLKKMDLYVKPEDKKAYYVANESINGSIDL